MSSEGNPPPPARPSVFISYASEDRAAARRLREFLASTGLEVWYDENELSGGDAWDQKIRRQIRECDYFMPVISTATERRKEGYFRREWRLATERTMDMADDVLFLLPVAIDDTSQTTARVPDRFLTVQWLRAPDGRSTPALVALSKRLLAGDHTITSRPPMVVRRPAGASRWSDDTDSGSTLLFPDKPANLSAWPRYGAQLLWWFLQVIIRLFTRAPRWVGTVAILWIVITIIGTSLYSRRRKPAETAKAPVDSRVATKAPANEKGGPPKMGARDAGASDANRPPRRNLKAEIDQRAMNKPLVLVPFGRAPSDPAASQFATAVFTACYGQLLLTRPGVAAVSSELAGPNTEEALAAQGRALNSGQILGARIAVLDGKQILAVRLIKVADGSTLWSADYPIAGAEESVIANAIAASVLRTMATKKK